MKKYLILALSIIASFNLYSEEIKKNSELQQESLAEVTYPSTQELPKFKPSGWAAMELKYKGNAEHEGSKNQNFMRTQFQGSINMTEKDAIQWRIRSYDDFNSENGNTPNYSENTEARYRWLHKHGTIAESKIKFETRYELRDRNDYDKLEAQARFEFVDYAPDFKYLDTTKLLLAPKLRYTELDGTGTGNDDTSTGIGMNLEWYGVTAQEWEWEINVYYTHQEEPGDYTKSDANSGDATHLDDGDGVTSSDDVLIEFYTYWTHNLWNSADGFYSINTYLENGLDPYMVDTGEDEGSYDIYTWPELQLKLTLNPATAITFGAGASYENRVTDDESAQGWEWQPVARMFFKTIL